MPPSKPGKDRPQCSLLLFDGQGRVLLQLRDDKPSIPYPDRWGTFGGQVEDGETPEQAMIRETREELGYELKDPSYLGNFPFDGYDIHFFGKTDPTLLLDDLRVREGQGAAFFTIEQVKSLPCAFNAKEAILAISAKK